MHGEATTTLLAVLVAGMPIVGGIILGFIRYAWNDLRAQVQKTCDKVDKVEDKLETMGRDVVRLQANYDLHLFSAHDLHPRDFGDHGKTR